MDGDIPLPISREIQRLEQLWHDVVLSRCTNLSERTLKAFLMGRGMDVRPLIGASATGIIGYLCDHESKHKQAQLGWQGRQWGVVGRSNLDFDGKVVATATYIEHKQAARQYRRLQEHLRKHGGKYTGVAVTPSCNVSKSIFGNDERRYLQCLRLFHVEQNV